MSVLLAGPITVQPAVPALPTATNTATLQKVAEQHPVLQIPHSDQPNANTQSRMTIQERRRRQRIRENLHITHEIPEQREMRREERKRKIRDNRAKAGAARCERHFETVQNFKTRLTCEQRQEQQTETGKE